MNEDEIYDDLQRGEVILDLTSQIRILMYNSEAYNNQIAFDVITVFDEMIVQLQNEWSDKRQDG